VAPNIEVPPLILRRFLVMCCDFNCRRGVYAQNKETLTNLFVTRPLYMFFVWNVLHKCKMPFDVTWCFLIYYGIKNINLCIYNLVRHMLTLISKDFNNIN
jgi:hypothetical protein